MNWWLDDRHSNTDGTGSIISIRLKGDNYDWDRHFNDLSFYFLVHVSVNDEKLQFRYT